MVARSIARSSDSESKTTIIFYGCLFIFLPPHFLKTDIPETFPHNVA